MKRLNPVVVAYERGYRVTDDGRLFGTRGQELEIKIRSTQKYPNRQVSIDGKGKNFTIHRLAAYCFYGDDLFEEGITVRHLNGDVLDCRKSNIALGTIRENHMDKCPEVRSRSASIAAKSRVNLKRPSQRKLSDEQALDVKQMLSEEVDVVTISKKHNVSSMTIYQIKYGETYKDIILHGGV